MSDGSNLNENSTPTDATNATDVSSSATDAPGSGWLRRLLQFRLRTLMLLTVVAAIVTQWWLRPKPEEFPFGDFRVFKHVRFEPSQGGYSGPAAPFGFFGDPYDEEIRDGAYWICDKEGRVLVRGAFDDNVPIGRWRAYHPNGRRASTGRCDERGGRKGVWKSWHRNGRLKQTITYGPSRDIPNWTQYTNVRISVREGPATAWHDNGQMRWRGQFRRDWQDGRWEYFLPDGTVEADGEYQLGVRHGPWRILGRDGSITEAYYLEGELAEDPASRSDEQVRELLRSAERLEQERGLQLAAFSNRQHLLLEGAESDDVPLSVAALGRISRLESPGAETVDRVRKLAAGDPPELRKSAAVAARFALEPDAREEIFQQAAGASYAADQRRGLAAALARQRFQEYDFWGERLRRPSVEESRFAFQALLWNWSELYAESNATYPEGPLPHEILSQAATDEQVPERVRDMIQKWIDATFGGKGYGYGQWGGGFSGSIF